MKYSAQKLAKALFKMIEANPENEKKIVAGFISFCKEKRLGYLLKNLLKYLEIEMKREGDINTLKIFSAVELDEETIEDIKNLCQAPSPTETEVVENKKIIAGFIAYYQNKIIDASLENNLRLLKNKLINA